MRQYYGYGDRKGIKAVSKRGTFGMGWLARRWCDLLDALGQYAAANKGRSVARGQHVQSITVRPGKITGLVSDYSMLYRIEMQVDMLSLAQWEGLIDDIQRQPVLMAQVLGGDLPEALLPIFERTVPAILPKSIVDFEIACGCYGWETPCKHAAGVLYLIGEELDRDPLLLLTLRGMPPHELFARLSQSATEIMAPQTPQMPDQSLLAADPVAFWQGDVPPLSAIATAAAASAAPIPLNPFPFWSGSEPFAEAITTYTTHAARKVREMQEAEDGK